MGELVGHGYQRRRQAAPDHRGIGEHGLALNRAARRVFRWRKLLDNGTYSKIKEVAAKEGNDASSRLASRRLAAGNGIATVARAADGVSTEAAA
jgi:hypothetical protein